MGLLIGGITAATTLAGTLAGALGGDSTTTQESRLILDPETGLERTANASQQQQFSDLNRFVQAGPGLSDVRAGSGAARSLAALIQQFQGTGGLPGQQQINQANQVASGIFQAQQVGLSQAFDDQRTNAARQAAISGRSSSDPILAAKLAQEQSRQQTFLNAQQGSFASQIALDAPNREIGLASARANVLGGLASQALSNRQSLLAIGNQLRQQERQFRLSTATQKTTGSTDVGTGDRISAAISGGLSGLGAGLSAGGGLQALSQGQGAAMFRAPSGGGGGGGGFAQPAQSFAPIAPANNAGPAGIPLAPNQVQPFSGPVPSVGNFGFHNVNLRR